MRLTTMSRYGTRAVYDIACHSRGLPVRVKDIAERQQIPIKYLEQIFYRLKKADFLESARGPGGGYALARDPGDITVGDIIKAVEEDTDLVSCVCLSADGENPCEREKECVTRFVWQEAARRINEYFHSVTIADLCENTRNLSPSVGLNHPFEFSI